MFVVFLVRGTGGKQLWTTERFFLKLAKCLPGPFGRATAKFGFNRNLHLVVCVMASLAKLSFFLFHHVGEFYELISFSLLL